MKNEIIDKLNNYYYVRKHFTLFETERAMEAAIKEDNDDQSIEDQIEFKDFEQEMIESMINTFQLRDSNERLIQYLDVYAFVNDLATRGKLDIYYNFEKYNGQLVFHEGY